MEKNVKTAKQLERHFKGVSNHWRIQILKLVNDKEGISVEGIANSLNGNFKTISEHTKKLVNAGLMNKRYRGNNVEHALSPYGKMFLRFIKSF